MIQLGATYKDKITGFEGVATGHCEYLSGCHQTLLVPTLNKKTGVKTESAWFDDQRVERVGKTLLVLDNSKTPGCDMQAPLK